MNHRPFEDWLLSGEPLTPAQTADLHDHLAACETCTALVEVNTALRNVRVAAPAQGFTGRFQTRLAQQRARQRWRTVWGLFFLALAAAGVIGVLALRFAPPLAGLRLDLLPAYLSALVSLWFTAVAFGETLSVFLRIAAGLVPGYIWVLAAAILGLLSWLWVSSISRFAPNPIPEGKGPEDL
jgi:hypothetical protein